MNLRNITFFKRIGIALPVLLIVIYFLCRVMNLKVIMYVSLGLFLCCVLCLMISLYKMKMIAEKDKLRRQVILLTVIAVSLLMPILINESYKGTLGYLYTTLWDAKDALSFYGDYLTFAGAFVLGFVIYTNDKTNRLEQKLNRIKLLNSCLQNIDRQLRHLDSNVILKRIQYDSNWNEHFNEILSLGYKYEHDLRQALDSFMTCVENINFLLELQKNTEAINYYHEFIKRDQYSPVGFNHIEVMSEIYQIAYLYKVGRQLDKWDEKADTKALLAKLSCDYYYVVENKIYGYLLSRNINTVELNDIQYEIVDWLLQNATFKSMVKSKYDKRIISRVVFDIALMMKTKSELIDFCWNAFSLK